MKTELDQRVISDIATIFGQRIENVSEGHCARIDGLSSADGRALTVALRSRFPEYDIHVLASNSSELSVSVDRAVELRNLKERPLILVCPDDSGSIENSSLDNSFDRVPLRDLLRFVAKQYEDNLGEGMIATSIRQIWDGISRRVAIDDWVRFLSSLIGNEDLETLGKNLWMVGLIPDIGPGVERRISSNLRVVKSLAFPRSPASPLDDRLSSAEVADGAFRNSVIKFFDQISIPLNQRIRWCEAIHADLSLNLTFDKWEMTELVASDLESVTVDSFRKPNGSLVTGSGLEFDPDGQLGCAVSEERPAKIVLKWRTKPLTSVDVGKWRLDLLPPLDFRNSADEVVATRAIQGDKRRATFEIGLTQDDLSSNGRFVIRIVPLRPSGDIFFDRSGNEIEAESEEFDVKWTDEVEDRGPRTTSAESFPMAVVAAAMEGSLDERHTVSYDFGGSAMSVRLSSKIQKNIRISPLAIEAQRLQRADPQSPFEFILDRRIAPGESAVLTTRALTLPKAFQDRRTALLSKFAELEDRGYVESLEWSDELKDDVAIYLATYKRAVDSAEGVALRDLLAIDSIAVHVPVGVDRVDAQVLLPTHPLRLSWMARYDSLLKDWVSTLAEMTPAQRKFSVDLEYVRKITPSNLPFSSLNSRCDLVYYAAELTLGLGLYLPPAFLNDGRVIDAISSLFGLERVTMLGRLRSAQARKRSEMYVQAHEGRSNYRVIAVNPGNGEVVSEFIRPIVGEVKESDKDLLPTSGPMQNAEVIGYSDEWSLSNPIPALDDVQTELRRRANSERTSYLNPPLSVTIRKSERIVEDEQNAHLVLIQDIATGESTITPEASERQAFMDGLLTPVETRRESVQGSISWLTRPGLRSATKMADDLPVLHESHQRAVSRALGTSGMPALSFQLGAERIAQIRSLHGRSDWVVTLDRHIGLDLFEDSEDFGLGESYVLDYAPDFVEGISDRLTVTTTHRAEILSILDRAMNEMGLAAIGSESIVLENIGVVSGRLALRLISDNTQAKETVGIAATIAHLRSRGKLDGSIIFPIDSHQEVFGASAKQEGEGPRRCDFLIIRMTSRRIQIQCVEVKHRQFAQLAVADADRIVDQLNDTEQVLSARFFSVDPPRVDAQLQRAKFAALLHYYADRAHMRGLLTDEQLEENHRNIDAFEAKSLPVEITKQGYVIALAGDQSFPQNHHGVSIAVLTAESLGEVGFSTILEDEERKATGLWTVEPSAEVTPSSVTAAHIETRTEPTTASPRPLLADLGEPGTVGHTRANSVPVAKRGEGEVEVEIGVKTPEVPNPTLMTSVVEVGLGRDANNAEVKWGVSTKSSPHAFIVGIPGQGKSVTVRRIIDQFIRQGLPSLVFDFHGDMASHAPEGFQILDASEGLPFSPFELRTAARNDVNTSSLEVAEIIAYVCGLGEMQMMHVYKGLARAYENRGWANGQEGNGLPLIGEFADAVEQVESGAKGKNARNRLNPITDFGLFKDEAKSSFDPTGDGHGLIVDLSRISLESVQQAGAAFILRKIYRSSFLWGESSVMKLGVVLDEAHRLAKDKTLPKLMKEGRKYGISVIVASQSTDDFSKDVLANAGTKIAFRTNYPASKTVAGFLRGRTGQDLSLQIEQLGVGEAYVSTTEVNVARKVYMSE